MNEMKKSAIASALESHGAIVAQGPLTSFAPLPAAGSDALAVSFSANDYHNVRETLKRCNLFAMHEGLPQVDIYSATVDLMCAHTNDGAIDFAAMNTAVHIGDVMEFIARVGLSIDRRTGRLADGWRGKFHVKPS